MNENTTKISLELLILNDLLRTKAIDKDIYDNAVAKINANQTYVTTQHLMER